MLLERMMQARAEKEKSVTHAHMGRQTTRYTDTETERLKCMEIVC